MTVAKINARVGNSMNPSVLSVIAMKPTSTLRMRKIGNFMTRGCAVLLVEESALISSPVLTTIPLTKQGPIGKDGRRPKGRKETTTEGEQKIPTRKTGRGRGEFV